MRKNSGTMQVGFAQNEEAIVIARKVKEMLGFEKVIGGK
jgi:hypothetical protein